MSSHKKPPHTQHTHKQTHNTKRAGPHNADTPKPNKKQNTAAATAAGAASAAASSTPARPVASASMDDDDGLDPAWRTMYAPLPPALQPPTDHTPDAARAAASSSASAAAVGAVGGGYIPSLLCGLLPSPSSFESNFNSKVKDKHLVLDNTSAASKGSTMGANLGDSLAKAQRKRRKKRGIKMMSSNERKEKGMQHIPKEGVKYALFLPLHELWLHYMHDILDPSNSRGLSVGERVLKADYHGAIFTVVRCRSPTHVGQRGILIQETQETFVIVTDRDAVKVLPKRHTVFSFTVTPRMKEADDADAAPSSASASAASSAAAAASPQVFELFGDHLCFRSYERSARKFKAKATIML